MQELLWMGVGGALVTSIVGAFLFGYYRGFVTTQKATAQYMKMLMAGLGATETTKVTLPLSPNTKVH